MRSEPRAVGAAVGRSGRHGRFGSSRLHSIHARTINQPRKAPISNRRLCSLNEVKMIKGGLSCRGTNRQESFHLCFLLIIE